MKFTQKLLIGLSALMLSAATLCSCTTPATTNTAAHEPIVKEGAFISIDINPSIELVLNKNQTVTSVGAVNEDAEVMLWQEELTGLELENAIDRITTLALEMGYISEEDPNISITVTTDGGKTVNHLLTTIDETIEKSAKNAGLEVRVEEAVDLVLSKELERVKAQNADKKGYDDTLTLSRYRLVKSALRADRELTMDEAVLLSNEKLSKIVGTAQENAAAKFGEVCEVASTEAKFAYENAKQTLLDSAYTAVYTNRRNLSSLLSNYGAAYAGYRLAYRTIEHYAESLRTLIENPIFSSDDVFALANVLGIDTSTEAEYDAFKEAITDDDGQITRDSVNAYINKQYQNMDEEDRAKLEEAYDSVMDILDRLGAEASIVREDGLLLIRGALIGMGINISVKTYDDLPALLDAIQKKIDDTYSRIDKDLSENEKADVKEMQEKMSEKIENLEKTYREAVEQAQKEAEEHLNTAKERRANWYKGQRKQEGK